MADETALRELDGAVYSRTARKAEQARFDWWQGRASKRGIAPCPSDESKQRLAGALLKQGKYRSAAQCLDTLMKRQMKNRSCCWTRKHWG